MIKNGDVRFGEADADPDIHRPMFLALPGGVIGPGTMNVGRTSLEPSWIEKTVCTGKGCAQIHRTLDKHNQII